MESAKAPMSASTSSRPTSTGTPSFDRELAAMIDHTLLEADATLEAVEALCREARLYGFATVCINPCHVRTCSDALRSSAVKVSTVIGFPLGATTTIAKVAEAQQAIHDGASELDMVINIAMLKAGHDDYVRNEIASIVSVADPSGGIVKVILETALLDNEQKRRACLLSRRAGAQFVKTSTGFASGGATIEDIELLRTVLGNTMKIKASGGIRTRSAALEFVRHGADRIGASEGVKIVTEGF
jgi:deoxyribose-phosphate aldolase